MLVILNILRLFTNLITAIFFVIGAAGFIVSPTMFYPYIMYLLCGIFYFISVNIEIIMYVKESKSNNTN